MEKQLFKWLDFDVLEISNFQFYDVTTVVKIGDILAGTKFALASVDYENETLKFFNKEQDEKPTHTFKLKLQVELPGDQ